MLERRLVTAVAVAAAALVLPAHPSYAADASTDVYVATPDQGGDDAHDCAQDAPCATVQRAIDVAADAGTTIHVGAGTFDGEVLPGDKSVSVEGAGTGETVLTADGKDGVVVGVSAATTHVADLTVSGGQMADVWVSGSGAFDGEDVVLTDTLGCVLWVEDGSADLADSVVKDGGDGGCGPTPGVGIMAEIAVDAGRASLTRVQVLNPADMTLAVAVQGGRFDADQSFFADSTDDLANSFTDGVWATGGSVTVSRSTFHGFGENGVHNDGATTFLSDDTFQGNVVGVTGASGSTTVVRSTFEGEVGALQSDVAIAGSVLGPDGSRNCGASTITDLGYNLSADDTCGFTAATSKQDVADLDLDDGLTYRGGPGFLPTVATFWPSSAVDAIPEDATYGDQGTPLCPQTGSTDLRGVARPVGGGCDAGSMELVGTATTVSGPTHAKPHHAIDLTAEVTVPDVGVEGAGDANGTVTFRSGSKLLCSGVDVTAGTASCTTAALAAGRRAVTAVFVPTEDAVVHGSTSAPHLLTVGTKPVIRAPKKVIVHVGERVRISLRASGAPRPVVRRIAGHLPRGLTFHRGTGRATITGRAEATAVGTHHVRVSAVNLLGEDGHRLTLLVRR